MKRFLPFIIGLAMVIVGWKLWDGNEGSSLKDQEGHFKSLCEEGVKTTATLQNEYSQRKGKVVNMVTYKYDYVVNGQTLTKEVTSNKIPDNNEFEVTYLPNNPEVVERGNPCATYEGIKNNSSSSFLMYLGIGLFFVGLTVGYNGVKTMIRSK